MSAGITYCRCHCAGCGSHFTSLEAYDRHRSGPMSDRRCTFPDGAKLVERIGTCRLDDPTRPLHGVTIYEHESAARAREAFRGIGGRETARTERISASGGGR